MISSSSISLRLLFFGFVDKSNNKIKAGSDARNAKWVLLDDIPNLAFDHHEILQKIIEDLTKNQYFGKLSAHNLKPET